MVNLDTKVVKNVPNTRPFLILSLPIKETMGYRTTNHNKLVNTLVYDTSIAPVTTLQSRGK